MNQEVSPKTEPAIYIAQPGDGAERVAKNLGAIDEKQVEKQLSSQIGDENRLQPGQELGVSQKQLDSNEYVTYIPHGLLAVDRVTDGSVTYVMPNADVTPKTDVTSE